MSVRAASSGVVAYPRKNGESYFTPPYVTDTLVCHLRDCGISNIDLGPIWEPSAGAGHMSSVLVNHGLEVVSTDLTPAEDSVVEVDTRDFLSDNLTTPHVKSIITNPPYGVRNKLAEAFLIKALSMRLDGVVAMLLPFEFDAASSRKSLVGENPMFALKLTLAKRIRWLNVEQKEAGPMSHHSWFVYALNSSIHRKIIENGMMRTL